jgi:two-component system KDP operon response regulator KdpE
MNRKKILIVDDNQVILKTLSLKLNKDYDIITAEDGSEAVSAVRTKKPDLILLDINFPAEFSAVQWDGFRIIQWVRQMHEVKTLPIFIITGGAAAKYKERALAEGAAAFFQKPINNDQLLAAIREALEKTPAPAPEPAK